MTLTLEAQPRKETGSRACQKLRASGMVPAVVYGGGADTEAITLSAPEFAKVWREAGESTVIELKGLGSERTVLINDVEVDPLMGSPSHVDLYAVRTDQVVEVSVPLVFTGVSPAEKELGGTLIKVMHELDIEALPKDLPHEITVDISSLVTFDDAIHVKDVVLPQGVTAVTGAEEVVALVQEATEEEEVPVEAVDVSAVEVEKKGKEEEAPEAVAQ